MASITKINQGVSMDTPTSPPLTGPVSRAASYIAGLDLHLLTIRLIALSNVFVLVSLLYMIFVHDSPLGVLRPLQERLPIPRDTLVGAFAFLVYVDICHSLRGLSVSREMGLSIFGQGALAIVAIVFTITGDISTVALYSYGGVFVLSTLVIVRGVQSKYLTTVKPLISAKRLIVPILSLLLFLLGWGLITRPDMAVAQFIQSRYGLVFYVVLVALIGWGSGQLRRNHFSLGRMTRCLMGVHVFALMSVGLFVSGDGSSFLGVVMTVMMSLLCVLIPFVHASDKDA